MGRPPWTSSSVAGRGVKVLKLHPHTQRFDVADPRVLVLVQQAGALDLVVRMDNANITAGGSEHLFNLAEVHEAQGVPSHEHVGRRPERASTGGIDRAGLDEEEAVVNPVGLNVRAGRRVRPHRSSSNADGTPAHVTTIHQSGPAFAWQESPMMMTRTPQRTDSSRWGPGS